ncbi:hypothetical protein H6F95_08050 [Cyanobacteria bacterium FACHB-471]|nr:hypothetical protein [Cyanobacteria bacterium FACHB-471]
MEEALAAYAEAQRRDPAVEISGDSWNSLCWNGSLYGHAAEVLDACERAVALSPESESILDSRGLARALTGDAQGAIEDFRVFVRWADSSGDEELKIQRQRWIKVLENWLEHSERPYPFTFEALQAGQAPFEPGELDRLRGQ